MELASLGDSERPSGVRGFGCLGEVSQLTAIYGAQGETFVEEGAIVGDDVGSKLTEGIRSISEIDSGV